MKSINHVFIAIIGMVAIACSSQKYVSSETDDIYFSSADRFASSQNEFSTVTETDGSAYATQDDYKKESNGYFFKGSSTTQNDQNPNAASAYSKSAEQIPTEFNSSETNPSTEGAVVNNYYGNTTVYSDEYYDTDYAARIRRFNAAPGYGYYDPFFVDPYWNYGWTAWNPYPYSGWNKGWNIGWNSWSGWNVGYNFGWTPYYSGYWGNAGMWGFNYWNSYNFYRFGYGNPYRLPRNNWGFGNYYGWNGFNNGYYNGFYDGFYANNSGRTGRGSYNGRRDLSSDPGIVGSSRGNSNPNSSTRNRVENSNQSPKTSGVNPNTNSSRADDRMASSSGIYQINPVKSPNNTIRNEVTKSELANPNSRTSSARYEATGRTQSTVNTRNKYEASTLSRAESVSRRYQAPNNANSNVRSSAVPSRNSNTVRSNTQSSQNRNASPNVRSSSPRSNNVTTPNRSTAPNYYKKNQSRTTPSSTQNSRHSAPQRTSPNVSPRSNRSSSPAVRSNKSSRSNFSAPSGRSSSGSMSAPSRSSVPRSAPSGGGSRGSSSPNRGGRR